MDGRRRAKQTKRQKETATLQQAKIDGAKRCQSNKTTKDVLTRTTTRKSNETQLQRSNEPKIDQDARDHTPPK
jgi:hypothetical protein